MPKTNPRTKAARGDARAKKNVSTPVRTTSVRVGDVPLRRSGEAVARSRRSARRYFIRLGIAAVVVIGLVVGGIVLFNSNTFSVNRVTASGVSHLTATEVTELAAVPADTTLLRVDEAGIRTRLLSNPWIDSVSVNRVFPDTIDLAITERAIAAVVTITSTESQMPENWAIASDGTWLMRIPDQGTPEAADVSAKVYEDAQTVLHISDVPYGVAPGQGSTCTDDSVLNALAIVSGMTTDLADRVSAISAAENDNTVLTLDDGIQIAFGTATDIRSKERICLELMEQNPGRIAYINVGSIDHPTWRAVS